MAGNLQPAGGDHVLGHWAQRLFRPVIAGHCAEQGARIRVCGLQQHVGDRALLHHPPGIEQGDLVADLRHHAHVMRYEDGAGAMPRLHLADQP